MSAVFGHTQWLTMNGQDPPVRSNMVDLDPTVTDAYGFPVSRITYSHHPNDYTVAAYAIPKLPADPDRDGGGVDADGDPVRRQHLDPAAGQGRELPARSGALCARSRWRARQPPDGHDADGERP